MPKKQKQKRKSYHVVLDLVKYEKGWSIKFNGKRVPKDKIYINPDVQCAILFDKKLNKKEIKIVNNYLMNKSGFPNSIWDKLKRCIRNILAIIRIK